MKLLAEALSEKHSKPGSRTLREPVVAGTALNPFAGKNAAPRLSNAGRAEERVRSQGYFFLWFHITCGATASV